MSYPRLPTPPYLLPDKEVKVLDLSVTEREVTNTWAAIDPLITDSISVAIRSDTMFTFTGNLYYILGLELRCMFEVLDCTATTNDGTFEQTVTARVLVFLDRQTNGTATTVITDNVINNSFFDINGLATWPNSSRYAIIYDEIFNINVPETATIHTSTVTLGTTTFIPRYHSETVTYGFTINKTFDDPIPVHTRSSHLFGISGIVDNSLHVAAVIYPTLCHQLLMSYRSRVYFVSGP